MTQRSVPTLFIALTLGCAAGIGHAQATYTNEMHASAPVARISNSNGVIVAPGGASQIRASGGNVTIIYGDNSRPVYAPPCNTYPAYPVYAPPCNNYPAYPVYAPPCNTYPAYPNYGYGTSTYGSSVSISTPGFQDQNFRLFPYSTTVSVWGSNSGYNNCAPQYPRCNSYPAYPTYVPGPAINGYRGAAGGYNFNGGSMVGGGYVGSNGSVIGSPYAVGSVRR